MIPLGRQLFYEHNGKTMKYRDLPDCAKNAIVEKYLNELGVEIYDDSLFGYVELPIYNIKRKIELIEDDYYKDFDTYHEWYMDSLEEEIPKHAEVWAIILDNDLGINEVIFDGWHRFHYYVDKEIDVVPAVLPMFSEN